MVMRRIMIGSVVIVSLGGLASAWAAPKPCTREEARQAEQDTDHLHDWAAMYKSFQQFGHCDDGSIAEGYDAAVTALLVHNWKHVSELQKLTTADPDFKRFVMRHIDELMTPDEAKVIGDNAAQHCPPTAAELCSSIKSKLVTVATEIQSHGQK